MNHEGIPSFGEDAKLSVPCTGVNYLFMQRLHYKGRVNFPDWSQSTRSKWTSQLQYHINNPLSYTNSANLKGIRIECHSSAKVSFCTPYFNRKPKALYNNMIKILIIIYKKVKYIRIQN